MITPADLMINVYRYFMTAISPQEQQAALAENRTPQTVVEQLHALNLLGSDSTWDHFVFRGNEEDLPVIMEASGSACVLLSHGGYWTTQNRQNTMKFPQIWVSLFADTSRDDNAIPTNLTAQRGEDKVQRMYDVVSPIFHDPTNTIHRFGDIHVVNTFESQVPVVEPVDDDGLFRLISTYEVTL